MELTKTNFEKLASDPEITKEDIVSLIVKGNWDVEIPRSLGKTELINWFWDFYQEEEKKQNEDVSDVRDLLG